MNNIIILQSTTCCHIHNYLFLTICFKCFPIYPRHKVTTHTTLVSHEVTHQEQIFILVALIIDCMLYF